jgi:DNA ligase-3
MQPVWEITGAEFTNQGVHTANGISIRFPRVTRIREDKDWETATNFRELQELFKKSAESIDYSLLLSSSSHKRSADDASDGSRSDYKQSSSPKKKKDIGRHKKYSDNSSTELNMEIDEIDDRTSIIKTEECDERAVKRSPEKLLTKFLKKNQELKEEEQRDSESNDSHDSNDSDEEKKAKYYSFIGTDVR